MPPVAEAPAPRLTLADLDGPGAPPDDYVQPPSGGAPAGGAATSAPAKGAVEEPPIKPIADDAETDTPTPPEPDPDAAAAPKKDPNEPEPTLSDSMTDPTEAAKAEADAKTAKEKKDAEEAAAAAERAKKGEATPPPERDADLKYEPSAHTHPKTRKIITQFQTAAKAARDEREAAIKRAEAAELKAKEAEEKAKTVVVPKEIEDEVKTLRERVRELDITKDPIIEQKYDRKIAANNDGILAVLKSNGYGAKVVDGKTVENPAALAKLAESGLGMKTVYPLIVQLQKAAEKFTTEGNEDAALQAMQDADTLRDLLRENGRISQEKTKEIESWKGDHAKRQLERQTQTKHQQETQAAAFRQHTDAILKSDLETLAKDFSYINRPADPLPTDTPLTKKAKEAAIAEYDAAAKAIETAVTQLKPDAAATPEKLAEVVGRVNANAIQAQVLKLQVLPRLKADLAAARKERDEFRAELEKVRDAGKLSRQHSTSPSESPNRGETQAKSLDEAFVPPPGV